MFAFFSHSYTIGAASFKDSGEESDDRAHPMDADDGRAAR